MPGVGRPSAAMACLSSIPDIPGIWKSGDHALAVVPYSSVSATTGSLAIARYSVGSLP
jgi:hypothetical protein